MTQTDPLYGKVPTSADLGVKAIDDWTLEVTMAGPRAYFPQVAAYTAAVPAPKWQVEKYGESVGDPGGDRKLVSNGPSSSTNGTTAKFIRMPRTKATGTRRTIKLDNVVEPIYPADQRTVLLFEYGSGDQQLDWAVLVGSRLQALLEDDPTLPS